MSNSCDVYVTIPDICRNIGEEVEKQCADFERNVHVRLNEMCNEMRQLPQQLPCEWHSSPGLVEHSAFRITSKELKLAALDYIGDESYAGILVRGCTVSCCCICAA